MVLITNPKLEHSWVNHECKSQSIHEITIQFHRSSLPDELLGRSQFESIKTLFERAQKGSVAEIGYACGFNNLSNFNRIFKKKVIV
ncbi:hypothetical protein [uncultured Parabacteroides sp.]|uniref:hypothetical protein n=1 Tax=uncultured Parabacteroides sp. TaxID=512312 RepID=UPI0025D1F4FE|nr:hypothetical protein [uncultured Parabacteroides sp.]